MPRGKFDSTNQKHYSDLGSDASAVANSSLRLKENMPELEEFSLTVTILLVSQEFAVTGILASWKASCRKDYCEETPS